MLCPAVSMCCRRSKSATLRIGRNRVRGRACSLRRSRSLISSSTSSSLLRISSANFRSSSSLRLRSSCKACSSYSRAGTCCPIRCSLSAWARARRRSMSAIFSKWSSPLLRLVSFSDVPELPMLESSDSKELQLTSRSFRSSHCTLPCCAALCLSSHKRRLSSSITSPAVTMATTF
ncbi:hypothetical protein NP493_6g07029 [Ridgeia piscesae]|uniref:Uncharacterized protein n=1 Tax=Ridgeia piscesae TaxID=27915 RepID=A0AAD9ULR2_RIDPI|nr:hypothetical protein NP493_6g07029 [Ridgeia piscesae]